MKNFVRRSATLLAVFAITTFASQASGALFTVVNGDFEAAGDLAEPVGGSIDNVNVGLGWYVSDNVLKGSENGNAFLTTENPHDGGFSQALSTEGVAGQMYLRLDVMVENGGDNAAPSLKFLIVGETNPWNSAGVSSDPSLNQNKQNADIYPVWPDEDRADIAAEPSLQPFESVDLTQANSTTWTTFEYTIDVGDGFNHSQGGTAGDPVAYLCFGFSDVYTWEGDSLSVDNVRFEPIPEPATMSLLGLGGLVALRRRRR